MKPTHMIRTCHAAKSSAVALRLRRFAWPTLVTRACAAAQCFPVPADCFFSFFSACEGAPRKRLWWAVVHAPLSERCACFPSLIESMHLSTHSPHKANQHILHIHPKQTNTPHLGVRRSGKHVKRGFSFGEHVLHFGFHGRHHGGFGRFRVGLQPLQPRLGVFFQRFPLRLAALRRRLILIH